MRKRFHCLAALCGAAAWMSLASTAMAYDVYCRDGTISHSGGRQGACSYHGGVAGPVGGGTTPVVPTPVTPTPIAPTPVAPTDVLAPTMSVSFYAGPSATAVGDLVTPPSVSLSDDTAWPASATGYTATLTWGDGLIDGVVFAGVSSAYASVTLVLPTHAYAVAGIYRPTLAVTDPAGHTTTSTLLTVTAVPPLVAPPGYPQLVGVARVGRTLTCVAGDWGDGDAHVQFRWLLDGRAITGQSRRTLLLHRWAGRHRVACRITVHNAAASMDVTSRSRSVAPRRHPAR